VSKPICKRCGEPLVLAPDDGYCVWCREERVRDAVTKLAAAAKAGGDAALAARVDAIDTLRNLGYSKAQVIHARAQAVDGHSVEQILEGLNAASELSAVAA
jgi:hypothetical protein